MSQTKQLPSTVQLCLPSTHAVLPGAFTRHALQPNYYAHHPTEDTLAHPHQFDKPFVAHHSAFLDLLGENPTLSLIASSEAKFGGDGREFAHEAGVWIEETNEVWFTSNLYKEPFRNEVSVIHVPGSQLPEGVDVGKSWRTLSAEEAGAVVTGNGATLLKSKGEDHVLFCSQGLGQETPSALVMFNPRTKSSWPILNNFHGRPYNSINDVVVLGPPGSKTSETHRHDDPQTTIWFTDPTYGAAQAYKPRALLPNMVYCFHPASGTVRAVADFVGQMPNGLCFNHEGTKLYVTDTACVNAHETPGKFSVDSSLGGGIFVFDVERPQGDDYSLEGPILTNKRLFAFSDGGAPDGIKTDTAGNVYSGTCDGVQVWNKHGTLIGKIVVFPDEQPSKYPSEDIAHKSRICANLCFLPGGRLFIMCEDRIYIAQLDKSVQGALLPH